MTHSPRSSILSGPNFARALMDRMELMATTSLPPSWSDPLAHAIKAEPPWKRDPNAEPPTRFPDMDPAAAAALARDIVQQALDRELMRVLGYSTLRIPEVRAMQMEFSRSIRLAITLSHTRPELTHTFEEEAGQGSHIPSMLATLVRRVNKWLEARWMEHD
jgi:hypothetical protein